MHQPIFHPAVAIEVTSDALRLHAAAVAVDKRSALTPSVRVASVWHETLSTFARRSELILPAVLLCALAGVCWMLLLDERIPLVLRLSAGCVGSLVLTLAQGVLAWVGLHGSSGARLRVRRVLCAVTARWQALAVGSLLYGALAVAGAGGLDGVLHTVDLNGPARPPLRTAFAAADEVIRDLLVQSTRLSMIPPPAFMWEMAARSESDLHMILCDPPVLKANPFIAAHCDSAPLRPAGAVEYRGLLLLVMAEILLRFRLVTALQPNRARTGGRLRGPVVWVQPSFESARTVLRHLPVVATHVWLLRLSIACVGGLFLVLPAILEQRWLMANALMYVPAFGWVDPLLHIVTSAATVLIGALVLAFCTLYDARLFVRLNSTFSDKCS